MKPVISVKSLEKSFRIKKNHAHKYEQLWHYFFPTYDNHYAVRDINFEVHRGERIAFIGPNGAGKSTTIKMLTGIFQATNGSIKVLDLDPYKDRIQLAHRIGTIFGQRSQLWQHLPALNSFNLLAAIYNLDTKAYQHRLDELQSLFKLEQLLHRPVKELSLGERMRCELVASLLHNPDILFLDEPTIGLDLISKSAIRHLIYERSELESTTIFLTSHDIADIEHVCDRIILINKGKIVIDTPLKEMRKRYLHQKQIIIRSTAPLKWQDCAGIRLTCVKNDLYTFEVNLHLSDTQAAIQSITKMNLVSDITVQDPALEDLIKQIYGQSE